MCNRCHEEQDSDYEGDSLEAKRRKVIQAIIERHSELGLNANEVTFRFAPKAEKPCVRVNMGDQPPLYAIHVPGYTAQMMPNSLPLSGIAMAVWIETSQSYEEIADILAIHPRQRFGALFVTETPPINPNRVGEAPNVFDYEQDIDAYHTDE